MIYIPHPTFNFENSEGGHVIGCVNHYDAFRNMIVVESDFEYEKFHLLQPDRVFSKFEKAISPSRPWRFGYHPGLVSFLREDGSEFAIRFLHNKNIDVLGYWIVDDDNNDKRRKGRYPRSYYDFLEWLGEAVSR